VLSRKKIVLRYDSRLLSSGGQQATMQRAVQLQNYANNINKPQSAPIPQQALTSGEPLNLFKKFYNQRRNLNSVRF